MGGTVLNDSLSGLATAVLTIPQTVNTNNMAGTITYKYHHHTNSCYSGCNGTLYFAYGGNVGSDQYVYRNVFKCNVCGAKWWDYDNDAPQSYTSPCPQGGYTCGYSEGQLIGAEIIY